MKEKEEAERKGRRVREDEVKAKGEERKGRSRRIKRK